MAQPYQLVVDLGTCHTVAVVRRAGEAPRPLLFDGSPLLSSGIYRAEDGRLSVGRDAERLAATAPSRFEPYPKRTVDDGAVLLGDGAVPVVELLAAILRRVTAEAAQQGGDPGVITLTCPADWGPRRREVLLAAARVAGLPQVRLVDEPIAAATYCAEVLGQQIPPGRCLLVFDFGGGTLDVTVVRREAPQRRRAAPDTAEPGSAHQGLRVLAVGGLDDLGGVDVDAALVGHLGQLVSLRAPQVWQRLMHPRGTGDLRDRKAFWDQVRGAKEMLSRVPSAPVPLPGSDDAVHLTREELERVAGPLVDRAVDETRRVLERAGVDPRGLAGILLVGGSSRIPLVASRLHARFGVAPTVPEQPELPVAYGGLLVGAPPPVDTPTVATPVVPPPMYPPAPPPQRWAPAPVPAVAAPRPPRRRPGRTAVIVLVSLAVLGALSWGGAYAARSINSAVHGATTGGTGHGATGGNGGSLAAVKGFPISLPGGAIAATALGTDAVFYATVDTGKTNVHAVPLAGTGGGPRWDRSAPIEPADLTMKVVNGLLILDGSKSGTNNGDDARAVLDVATGNVLWEGRWEQTVDIEYVGTDVIVSRDFPLQTQRVNLRTGKAKWTHQPPAGVTIAWYPMRPALTWQAAAGSGTAALPRSGGAFQESFAADTTRIVQMWDEAGRAEVLNTTSGRPVVSQPVRLADELNQVTWVAYDGLLVGAAKDGAAALIAYRLDTLTEAWRYRLPAGASVQLLKGCGQHRICVSSEVSSAYQVMAVDTGTGKAAWSSPLRSEFAHEPGWYVLGQKVVYGYVGFVSVGDRDVPASLLDDRGTPSRVAADTAVTVNAGDGRYELLVKPQLSGSTVHECVALVDVATGKQTGWQDVGVLTGKARLAVTGNAVAVINEGKLYVMRAPGLAAR